MSSIIDYTNNEPRLLMSFDYLDRVTCFQAQRCLRHCPPSSGNLRGATEAGPRVFVLSG